MITEKAEQARITVTVRPDEVDPYGIVHHSRYAAWSEMALCELLKARKRTFSRYSVSRFQCKYQLSARLDSSAEILIRTRTGKHGQVFDSDSGFDSDSERFLFQVSDMATHRIFASGELEVQVIS